jgi:hypothetical protein
MPWVGFEPTILVFERAKTFHALDRAAAVIGLQEVGGNIWNQEIPGLKVQAVIHDK